MKGKDNEIADFLSRNPLWSSKSNEPGPWITDDFGKEITVEAHKIVTQAINKYEDRILSDSPLKEMRDAGAMDD